MQEKIGIFLFIVFCLCLGFGGVYFAVHGQHVDIENRGKADRQNGHPIQSNPYIDPTSRDLWYKGWRESKPITE